MNKAVIREYSNYTIGKHGFIIIEPNGSITKDSNNPSGTKIFPSIDEAKIYCISMNWKF